VHIKEVDYRRLKLQMTG